MNLSLWVLAAYTLDIQGGWRWKAEIKHKRSPQRYRRERTNWCIIQKSCHQIGVSQLAGRGAPVSCVVLNEKQYEPDSLEPLLKDLVEKHPELDMEKVNADGIFNSQPCRDKVREILGEQSFALR